MATISFLERKSKERKQFGASGCFKSTKVAAVDYGRRQKRLTDYIILEVQPLEAAHAKALK